MKVDFYTSTREYGARKAEFDQAIQEVLDKGGFILGEQVAQLEKEIQQYTSAAYAIGVASGTDGLTIAADILGFKDGKEVITSPFTFLASASCIARHKGRPVFVDIDEETFQMDVTQIEEKITKNTVGLLPVHLFDQITDMDGIMDIAGRYGLKVLEDSAEAFGMMWRGRGPSDQHAGTMGDFGVFSFFPTKTLGGYGDGGMMVTNNPSLAQAAKAYRKHGAVEKYRYQNLGYNSRLDTLQAAILLVKLRYIEESIQKRKHLAEVYADRLKDCDPIRLPKVQKEQRQVYYVFNILAKDRDHLAKYLSQNGIGYNIYYPSPLHMQECFRGLGYHEGDFPVAEKVSQSILALPLYPELELDEVEFVCDTIKSFYRNQQ